MKSELAILDDYLDEVAAHLGPRKGRRDLLLELRSAILDRAEEIGEGVPDAVSLKSAVTAMGDPAEVALAYTVEKYLVGPRMYRPFLIYTGILFVAHVVMILVATATDVGIEVFPVSIMKVARPHTFVNLLFVATQALLLDIGLMVVIFTGVARAQRTVRLPSLAFRVQASFRPSISRAVFTFLVLVILNLFRNHLFVVAVDEKVYPIFTASFIEILPLLNVLLALVIVRDTAYAFLGERKFIVAADAALSIVACATMIWLMRRPSFLALPTQLNEPSAALPTMNQLLAKGVELLLVIFAVALAVQAVKRFVRLRQIWD